MRENKTILPCENKWASSRLKIIIFKLFICESNKCIIQVLRRFGIKLLTRELIFCKTQPHNRPSLWKKYSYVPRLILYQAND